ncbi:MAG: alpha/beta fold hydrolase [Ilumatobacteraceae bacterium]|nr:alpha/beta fold hydrolase [Ilumatobacteraceae bacterium]
MHNELVHLLTIDNLILDGDLWRPDGQAKAGFVVCHPHPLYGGSRHDMVVAALVRAAINASCPAIAFDFRGVGMSQGKYDGNGAERLDIAAAIDLMSHVVGDLPIIVAGYSFGAATALWVVEPRIGAWIALAPPLEMFAGSPVAAHDHHHKFILMPEHDQFTSIADARIAADSWRNTSLDVLVGADHFMAGCFDQTKHSVLDELVSRAIASAS